MAESALRNLVPSINTAMNNAAQAPFGRPQRIPIYRNEPEFIDRSLNPQNYPVINNPDGSISSHRMAAEVDENGNWYVFPTIQMQPDGTLRQYDDAREAMKAAFMTGNILSAPNMESALQYAEGGYKVGTPMEQPRSAPAQEPVQSATDPALRQIATQSAEPYVRSYNPLNPKFRESVRSALNDLVGGSNIASNQGYGRGRMVDMLTGTVDFAPVLGDAVGIGETRQALNEGDYLSAGIIGTATALGMVPIVGDVAGKALRRAARSDPIDMPSISAGSKINLNPNKLTFREADQDQYRVEQVAELFDSGEEINPIVTIYNNGRRDILDGHHRAAVAISRRQNLPAVDIDIKEYERLKEAGFDDMEITYATLLRANEDDAASAINNQFYGAGIRQRGTEALSLMDDPAAVVPAPSPLEGTLDMSSGALKNALEGAAPQGTYRLEMLPSGNYIAHGDNDIFTVKPVADKFQIKWSPQSHLSKAKPFTVEGASIDEVVGLADNRLSNSYRTLKGQEKYNSIPSTWTGEAKQIAKRIIDSGISVQGFSGSTQSKSKYIEAGGNSIRISDHTLPNSYDSPDIDYRYGGDINKLIDELHTRITNDLAADAPDVSPSPLEGTLDMSQGARMQRAAEQGFNVDRPVYHWTDEDFSEFELPSDPNFQKLGQGVYTSPEQSYGERYVKDYKTGQLKEGANVLPLVSRGNLASPEDYEKAFRQVGFNVSHDPTQKEIQRILKDQGFTGIDMNEEVLIFDPVNLRSVNAAFDPAKRGSANLMAGAAGATIGLSALRNIQRDEEPQPD